MKRLILMRHAKSDWSGAATSDHDRGLNQRGRRSADAMGKWMQANGYRPDHVLCSDATRTRETLSRLGLEDVQITFSSDLYLANPDVMLGAIRSRSEDCIMMVAHNPGCAILAATLLVEPSFEAYPTCATLVADFDISDWHHLQRHTGRTTAFVVPRTLID